MTVSESTYTIPASYLSPDELRRLDKLHAAFTEYFSGNICCKSFRDTCPRRVLDIGCGTGAWSIAAAKQFPDAEVISVDLNPLPSRPLPSNIRFVRHNLTEVLPFEKSSFDIVHARLVVMHVPKPKRLLNQMFELVKPGGWLFITDPDSEGMDHDGVLRGAAATSPVLRKWYSLVRKQGANPVVARDYKDILESSGDFENVDVQKLVLHTCPAAKLESIHESPEEKLGTAWGDAWLGICRGLSTRYPNQGFTPEAIESVEKMLKDPNAGATGTIYFASAQKKGV